MPESTNFTLSVSGNDITMTDGTTPDTITATGDDIYLLVYFSGYVVIQVTDFANLGGTNPSAVYTFAYNSQGLLPDVDSDQSTVGGEAER